MAGDLTNCIVDPWPWQWTPTCPPQPTYTPLLQPQHTHYHFMPYPQETKLSDEDAERIAKRVAELLKGDK
jgi:hypothetical protein